MNDRQRHALAAILNDTTSGAPPPDLTATRRHKKTGLIIMSLLAVDR